MPPNQALSWTSAPAAMVSSRTMHSATGHVVARSPLGRVAMGSAAMIAIAQTFLWQQEPTRKRQ